MHLESENESSHIHISILATVAAYVSRGEREYNNNNSHKRKKCQKEREYVLKKSQLELRSRNFDENIKTAERKGCEVVLRREEEEGCGIHEHVGSVVAVAV